MSIKEINLSLQRVQTIIDKWNGQPKVSDIERELVLEKLRNLYEQVMFLECEKAADEPMQWIDIEQEVVDDELMHTFSDTEPSGQESETAVKVTTEVALVSEFEAEPAFVPEPEIAFEPEPVVEPVTEPVVEPAQVAPAPTHTMFKPKLDRSVIMSLYGDDTPTQTPTPSPSVEPEPQQWKSAEQEPVVSEPAAPEFAAPESEIFELEVFEQVVSEPEHVESIFAEPAQEQYPVTQEEPTKEPEFEIVSMREEIPFEMKPMMAEPTAAPKMEVVQRHTQIIGEVINAGEQTLGETIGRRQTQTDVASKIVTDRTTGLRKSIGINDKFLMIRDIFAGDASAFESTMRRLEEFTDLNDALLYIHDTYDWNPNSDGVKLLIELLTRKLS